jgi:predicted small secreted protein
METVRSLWTRASKPLVILLAVVVVGGVAACQTTKGAGRDIENLGDNIEDAAEAAD